MKVASNLVKDIRKYYCDQLCSIYDKDEANAMILILFEHYFNIDRVKMALEPDIRLSESEMLKIHFAVKDLLKNKPIQYIIGETELCELKFKVNEDVLIPRPETAEMIYKIVNKSTSQQVNKSTSQSQCQSQCQSSTAKSQKPKAKSQKLILDIGTGSGCIAISLAKMLPEAQVYALDISEKALVVAKENAKINDVNITFIHEDILTQTQTQTQTKFDIIVSNPPYVRELEKSGMRDNVLKWEPHNALFVSDDNPLIFYRKILEFAKSHLKENGEIWFEINEFLGKEMIDLCHELGFSDVEIYEDFRGKERIMAIHNS